MKNAFQKYFRTRHRTHIVLIDSFYPPFCGFNQIQRKTINSSFFFWNRGFGGIKVFKPWCLPAGFLVILKTWNTTFWPLVSPLRFFYSHPKHGMLRKARPPASARDKHPYVLREFVVNHVILTLARVGGGVQASVPATISNESSGSRGFRWRVPS